MVQDSRIGSRADGPVIVQLPDALDFEQATFWPLTTSAVLWLENDDIQPDDTVVIVGQGLVGSLMLQVARANGRGRLVAVDALPICAQAAELEADEVINAADEDPVARVLELTDGNGADVVIYAVGGRAGLRAFDQAQRMTARGGLLQVVGLYEDDPLPLSSSEIQRKRLIGGALPDSDRVAASARALDLLTGGRIATERMVTTAFPTSRRPRPSASCTITRRRRLGCCSPGTTEALDAVRRRGRRGLADGGCWVHAAWELVLAAISRCLRGTGSRTTSQRT